MKSPRQGHTSLSSRDRLPESKVLCSPCLPACPGDGNTYFSVSLLLQVEQEKQFTHQALLRADTTVKGRRVQA